MELDDYTIFGVGEYLEAAILGQTSRAVRLCVVILMSFSNIYLIMHDILHRLKDIEHIISINNEHLFQEVAALCTATYPLARTMKG